MTIDTILNYSMVAVPFIVTGLIFKFSKQDMREKVIMCIAASVVAIVTLLILSYIIFFVLIFKSGLGPK